MNKYNYRFTVSINFNAELSEIENIQRYISPCLEGSVAKSVSRVADSNLDITDVKVYLSEKTDITAKEEKERLKRLSNERKEKKRVDPKKCNEDVQDVYFNLLSGTTDYYFRELLFVSEKHILFKVKGRTVHLQRTDYVYSPPEYYIINIHNAKISLKSSKYALSWQSDLKRYQIIEFFKEGRLTKEDKQEIYRILGQEIKL